MTDFSVAAFATFIDSMRTHYGKQLPEQDHWKGVRDLLKILCADQGMRELSRRWEAKVGREYILHHDPEYDFFVGALVREPNHKAGIHDHGPTWTIYGVLDGTEMTHIYDRIDDGGKPGFAEIRLRGKYEAPTGHVDIVPPHVPHAEWGVSDWSVAITVRTTKPGSYDQVMFHGESGRTSISRGLELVALDV